MAPNCCKVPQCAAIVANGRGGGHDCLISIDGAPRHEARYHHNGLAARRNRHRLHRLTPTFDRWPGRSQSLGLGGAASGD
jgi:hypothetical protein